MKATLFVGALVAPVLSFAQTPPTADTATPTVVVITTRTPVPVTEALAAVTLDLDHVTRAEILDRDDAADRLAIGRYRRQPDQVGVVVFTLAERRERLARHRQQGAPQRLGSGTVAHPGEARDRAVAQGGQR